MPELVPYPLGPLVTRMFRELEREQAIFDLPAARFYTGDPGCDHSVRFQGHRAASPLGPAAGPQTQMAQNIVLSWLGGCRVMELKTVQVLDELEIPRPCIDMRTVGLNAEWSQELKLRQSLEEYVKGAMLVEMLSSGGAVEVEEGFRSVVYDMSVGYDLAGIRSEPVVGFIRGMLDAGDEVERLRREIPAEFTALRGLDFPTRLSDTVTLSTFHGCPPDEIERIIEFLMRELGLHCIVKFNPMLLGSAEARRLLHEVLGYHDVKVPESAFQRDATWPQAVEIVERLAASAASLGLEFGVKFSNTLIVENTAGFLAPGEKEVYLSGAPLHVLAIHLVRRFRRAFGDRLPISFSAGVDAVNYPDAVALGLVPITVCTDLLRKGGYGRLRRYHEQLAVRMEAVGAVSVDEFTLRAYGLAGAALEGLDPAPEEGAAAACRQALEEGGDLRSAAGEALFARWVSAARLLNTDHYVERATADPRYTAERNARPPRKIGRHLKLFDCISCDICVPVCPNDANFTFARGPAEIPVVKARRAGEGWKWRQQETVGLLERHQIGTFADFCNDCGNCDVFCPEDGGPYVVKPRFFRRAEDWRQASHLDGFQLERRRDAEVVLGRFEGREFRLEVRGARHVLSGDGFELSYDEGDPEGSLEGTGPEEVDLTYGLIMDFLRREVLDPGRVNYVNVLPAAEEATS